MKQERFGIFGGTFAPVHLGHLRAAAAFLEQCALDTLHLIPTATPPHKQRADTLTDAQRLELLRLGVTECVNDPRIVIDDYEILQGGKSYTYLTLQHYAAPQRQIWFLVGTDMFLTLDQWKHPEIIFSLAHIAFLLREEANDTLLQQIKEKTEDYRHRFGAQITQLHATPLEISSSALRQKATEPDAYLPKSVKEYLVANRLL